MAVIHAEVKLPEIFATISVRLYFPTDLPEDVGNKVNGVITLLHGMGNSGADWMQMTAACRYAADNGYVLIAPDAGNSFYHNMAYGPPWHSIITDMLPAQLERIFHIPRARDVNYIAGLSMGGYGALQTALSRPDLYSAVGSFSGAVDVSALAQVAQALPAFSSVMAPVLGENMQVPANADIFKLAENVATLPTAERPRVFCSCGTRDKEPFFVIDQNRKLRDHMQTLPLDYTYLEWDGVHEWNFWDRSLAEFIGFIQNSDYAAKKRRDWSSNSTAETQA